MAKSKLKKWLALVMAGALCVNGYPGGQLQAMAGTSSNSAVSADSEDENVFKVELDASGNIVSDNSSDLEHRIFSWDNATVYFVLTDRFKNADKSNDHSYGRGMQADGKTPVEGLDTYTNPGTFHGGDIKGLTEKVEDGYFTDLGVNAIWITAPYEQIHGYTSANVKSNKANVYQDPEKKVFPYYSYHGYWALDYTNMDANMGTEQDFEEFVDSCHARGIRVVMDIVMNHVGYTTMQDAVDYGFDGALKGDWKSYYYGNSTYLMGGDPESTNYWDKESSAWSKWWGPAFVKADYPGYTAAGGGDIEMSLCGLPDVITKSSAPEGDTPPILKTKWTQEGRLEQEEKELSDYFSRTGNKKQARYYIIKWLSDWVRDYGVDGFRCDTAKHVDADAWKDLKDECVLALKDWRANNPDKPGADWTDDFWMTGEAWGHGMTRSFYYDNGFDSMINFAFNKSGNPAGMEETYKSYAAAINSDPTFNSLSYLTSHDDSDSTMGVWKSTDEGNKKQGTCLLLAPGGVQIYYGNEMNRGLEWVDFLNGNDYLDQRFRSDMPWDSYPKDVLEHWQKVGQFRNNHISVGAGQHEMLASEPYTFSRTYNLEEEDEDKVVCCVPGKAGTYSVNVGDVFEDGETVTDAYSGEKAEVSGGTVSFTCDANGVILIQGSGIVKASVSAKTANKATTYSSDTFAITLKANKAKDTTYSINDGTPVEFKNGDVIEIGGDTRYGEETKITLNGISEDDGSTLTKEVTYTRSAEPTVSDGQFYLRCSKEDFPTAPNVFIYTNDDKEEKLAGLWPGPVMEEDPDDSNYWCYRDEKIEDKVCIILSLGATGNSPGTWRSTPDKAKGLVMSGSQSYDKTSNELTELPSGDPGKVTINYVDTDGNELKSIYRVGVIGKKYTTYPATIEGYTLTETPKNATGEFAADVTVTYVYSKGGTVVKKTPTPSASVKPTASAPAESVVPATTAPASDNDTDKKDTPAPSTKPPVTDKNTPAPATKPPVTDKNTPVPTSTVTPAPTDPQSDLSVKLTTNKKSPQVRDTVITLTATASKGSGSYEYMFYVKDKDTGVQTSLQSVYKSNNKVTWKPVSAGNYVLVVSVKDTKTGATVKGQKSYRVEKPVFALNSFKVTKSGKKISMTASATPKSGSVKYRYVIKRGSKTVKSYKYSTKKTYSYKVSKKGTYRIVLYAKNGSNLICSSKMIKIK